MELIKKISRLEKIIKALEKSRDYYQKRCQILEKIIEENLQGMKIPKGNSQQDEFIRHYSENPTNQKEENVDVQFSFLQELSKNSLQMSKAHRFSESFLKFSYILYCLGSKSYSYLRTIFPFPSKSALLAKYQPFALNLSELLESGLNGMNSICSIYRKNHEQHFPIDATIGIDALAVEQDFDFPGTHDSPVNNIFMLYLMPLSPRLKSFPIMLIPHTKGNADQKILDIISQSINNLQYYGFNIKCKATDGDCGYNSWHYEATSLWWEIFLKKGFEAALKCISEKNSWPIADMLHIFKNARSRIINGNVSVRIDGEDSFNAINLEAILELGDALTDSSSKGKMKDFYCFEIFTIQNFFTLMSHKKYSAAFYILPYSLWGEVIRNPSYSPQLRLDLLVLIFDIFAHFKKNLENLTENVTQRRSKTGNKPLYFASECSLNRSLNTVLGIAREILAKPDEIALDRLGTHTLECAFGKIRLLCHNKHTRKNVNKSVVRLVILDEFTKELGIPIKLRNRINDGGVKLYGSENVHVRRPESDSNCFIEGMYLLIAREIEKTTGELSYNNELCESAENIVGEYISWFNKIINECKKKVSKLGKIYKSGPFANNGILGRLIASGNRNN